MSYARIFFRFNIFFGSAIHVFHLICSTCWWYLPLRLLIWNSKFFFSRFILLWVFFSYSIYLLNSTFMPWIVFIILFICVFMDLFRSSLKSLRKFIIAVVEVPVLWFSYIALSRAYQNRSIGFWWRYIALAVQVCAFRLGYQHLELVSEVFLSVNI